MDQVGKIGVLVASAEVRNSAVTREVLEDLDLLVVFLAQDLKVLDQSIFYEISNDPLSDVYSREVSLIFRFKVHHLVSVVVRDLQVLDIEVDEVRELLHIIVVVFFVRTYRDAILQTLGVVVQDFIVHELRVLDLAEPSYEIVFEEPPVH